MSVVCECGGEEQDDEGQHDGEDGYEDGFGARTFDAAACGAYVEEMWRHATRDIFLFVFVVIFVVIVQKRCSIYKWSI